MGALTARNQELENGKHQKREVSVFYCQKKRVPPTIRLPDIWMLTHQATVNLVDIPRILLIASRYEAVNTKAAVDTIKSLKFLSTIYTPSGATILLHVH